MKKLLVRTCAIVAAAGALCLGGASAASAQNTVDAHVPFPFVVNNVHFPAGQYTLTENVEEGFVEIRSVDGRLSALALTVASSDSKANKWDPHLQFVKADGEYVLRTLVTVNGEAWATIPASASRETAVNADNGPER